MLSKRRIQVFKLYWKVKYNKFYFSTSIDDTLQRERYQLANKLIEVIYDDSDQSISLKNKILLTIDNSGHSQNTRRYMRNMFVQGVVLDKQIFKQTRFINQIRWKQNQQGIVKSYFTYYPTYTVTSQIFKSLLNPSNQSKIVLGHFGISKTISTSLFWLLTNIISYYRFKSQSTILEKSKFDIPKVIFWSAEADIQSTKDFYKHIFEQCPELSTTIIQKDKNNLFGQDSFKSYYIQKKMTTCLVIDQLNVIVNKCRQLLKLQQKLIELQQNKSKSKQDLSQIGSLKQKIKNRQKNIQIYEQIFYTFRRQFHNVIGLSSMNIELYIIQKVLNMFGQGTHSSIIIDQIQYSSLIYHKNTMKQLALFYIYKLQNSLKGIYINKFKQLDDKRIDQIVKQCYQYLNQMKYHFFITPLSISDKLISINEQQILETADQFGNNLVSYFKKVIVNPSAQQFKQFLSEKLYKDSENGNDLLHNKLLFKLYNQTLLISQKQLKQAQLLEHNTIQQNKQHQTPQMTDKQLHEPKQTIILNSINIRDLGYNKKQIQQFGDRRLFRLISSSKLQLLLPPSLIAYVLQPIVLKYLLTKIKLVNQFFTSYTKKGEYGILFQRLLIFTICRGRTDVKFSSIQIAEPIIRTRSETFLNIPNIVFGFTPIKPLRQQNNFKQNKPYKRKNLQQKRKQNELLINAKRSQNFQFIKGLLTSYKLMKQLNINNAVYVPFTKIQLQKMNQKNYEPPNTQNKQLLLAKLFPTSPSIDFLLIRNKYEESSHQNFDKQRNFLYQQREYIVQIYAIDATTTFELSQEKPRKFLRNVLSFKDRNQLAHFIQIQNSKVKIKFELHYIIAGLNDNFSVELKQIKQQFSEYIKFQHNENSNILYVKEIQGQKQSLLRSIRYTNAKTQITFTPRNYEQELYYQNICKQVQKQNNYQKSEQKKGKK